MIFTVLLLGVSSLCVTAFAPAGDIVDRPHVRSAVSMSNSRMSHIIGGNGGKPFYHVGCRNGATVKSINVWMRGAAMKGIELKFSDGETFSAGRQESQLYSHVFHPGETIVSLRQTGNGEGTRHGEMTIVTSTGRTFAPPFHKTGWFERLIDGRKLDKYDFNVQSGTLCGIQGRAGDDIDALGFLFAAPAWKSVIDVDEIPDNLFEFTDSRELLFTFNNPTTTWMSANTTFETMEVSRSEWFIEGSVGKAKTTEFAKPHFDARNIEYEISLENGGKRASGRSVPITTSAKTTISPNTYCELVRKSRKWTAEHVPWSGTETSYLEDGSRYTMRVKGFMSGSGETNRSVVFECPAVAGSSPKI